MIFSHFYLIIFSMKNIEISFTNDKTQTISNFMLEKGFSSSNIFHEINQKLVLVNNIPVRDKNVEIFKGERIKVILIPEINELPLNKDRINILYEDEYLLIVNKPSNLLVEPYKIGTNNNLASMVTNYFFEQEIPSKVHIVNRLDKCTSGIVIIAKNRYIKNLMCNTKICKKYLAIVEGKTEPSNTIKINIGKEVYSNSRKLDDNGKQSITNYKTISYNEKTNTSLIEAEIITGRTHQIRLSFSSIGHPLVGDEIYGSKIKEDIYLMAYYTKFKHPLINKFIELTIQQ